jgi:hypothetical protein
MRLRGRAMPAGCDFSPSVFRVFICVVSYPLSSHTFAILNNFIDGANTPFLGFTKFVKV